MSSKIKNDILPFLLAIVSYIGIFLGEKILTYIIVILILTFFFEKDRFNNYTFNKTILLPFIVAISVYFIYTFLSPDIILGFKILERQISLLAIPLLIVFAKWEQNRISLFFRIFIITGFLIGVAAILKFLWFISINLDWISYMAEEKGSRLLYLQYKFPHVIGTHPTYWSYLLISAIIILWSNKNVKVFQSNSFIYFLLIFFNVNLFVLASRTPLLINIFVHIFFLIRFVNQEKISLVKKVSILLLVGSILFIGLQLPLLSNKLEIIKSDERFYHWPVAFKTIKQNFFVLGEGLGQSSSIIKNDIILNGDDRIRYLGDDLHNQYIREYLDMGILGIFSLILLLAYPLIIRRKKFWYGNSLYIPFIILFSLGLMTESYLYRLKGIVFFTVLSSILYLCALGIREENNSLHVQN